jgi:dipeptidyl aminopeptidase/acylaminoacyl peptidase
VHAPLHWEDDGQAVLFAAEQKAASHLWRFDLPDRRAEVVVRGGWVQRLRQGRRHLVTLADAPMHPARARPPAGREPAPHRAFNDADGRRLARAGTRRSGSRARRATGRRCADVAGYPPGFDPKKKYPVLHNIHGGPHTAWGDNWHYRWNTRSSPRRAMWWPASTTTAPAASATAFKDSITHRWGELELQDVEAATDWLLKKRWADKRACSPPAAATAATWWPG